MTQSFRYLKLAYLLMVVGIFVPFTHFIGGIIASLINPQDKSKFSDHCNYLLDTIWISVLGATISVVICVIVAKLAKTNLLILLTAAVAINLIIYLYRVVSGLLKLQKDISASAET